MAQQHSRRGLERVGVRQETANTGKRTPCRTVPSKDVERESPMWASSSQGKVALRKARLAAEPHVANTCIESAGAGRVSGRRAWLPHFL